MMVVSNTGPLIALAKIDALHRLGPLFGGVHIPPAVLAELIAKPGTDTPKITSAFGTIILPKPAPESIVIHGRLGAGEREAISLAKHHGALLIMDDSRAREAALSLGLSLTGTVGLVLEAHSRGLIPSARSALLKMRDRGYYLSDHLITRAALAAGESDDNP